MTEMSRYGAANQEDQRYSSSRQETQRYASSPQEAQRYGSAAQDTQQQQRYGGDSGGDVPRYGGAAQAREIGERLMSENAAQMELSRARVRAETAVSSEQQHYQDDSRAMYRDDRQDDYRQRGGDVTSAYASRDDAHELYAVQKQALQVGRLSYFTLCRFQLTRDHYSMGTLKRRVQLSNP